MNGEPKTGSLEKKSGHCAFMEVHCTEGGTVYLSGRDGH